MVGFVLGHLLGWGPWSGGGIMGQKPTRNLRELPSPNPRRRYQPRASLHRSSSRSHRETTTLTRNSTREGRGKPKAGAVLKPRCPVPRRAASSPKPHPLPAGAARAGGRGRERGEQGLGARSDRERALTVQAEGDVDGALLHKALQVGDLGTLEDGLGGAVTHVNPAHRVFNVVEVHGRGLLGAGGGDVGHRGAAQVGGQDVLGVGDEQHRRPVHGLWRGKEGRRVVTAQHPALGAAAWPFCSSTDRTVTRSPARARRRPRGRVLGDRRGEPGAGVHGREEAPVCRAAHKEHAPPVEALTILGFAGSVIRLQEVPFNTAARVGALRVGAGLAAGPVDRAFVKVWKKGQNPRGLDEQTPLLGRLKRERGSLLLAEAELQGRTRSPRQRDGQRPMSPRDACG